MLVGASLGGAALDIPPNLERLALERERAPPTGAISREYSKPGLETTQV